MYTYYIYYYCAIWPDFIFQLIHESVFMQCPSRCLLSLLTYFFNTSSVLHWVNLTYYLNIKSGNFGKF